MCTYALAEQLQGQMEPLICGWTLILCIWSLGQYHRCIEQEAATLLSCRQVFSSITEPAPPVSVFFFFFVLWNVYFLLRLWKQCFHILSLFMSVPPQAVATWQILFRELDREQTTCNACHIPDITWTQLSDRSITEWWRCSACNVEFVQLTTEGVTLKVCHTQVAVSTIFSHPSQTFFYAAPRIFSTPPPPMVRTTSTIDRSRGAFTRLGKFCRGGQHVLDNLLM